MTWRGLKSYGMIRVVVCFLLTSLSTSSLIDLKQFCDKENLVKLVLSAEDYEKPTCIIHVEKRDRRHCAVIAKIDGSKFVIQEETEGIDGTIGKIKLGDPWPGKRRCYVTSIKNEKLTFDFEPTLSNKEIPEMEFYDQKVFDDEITSFE